MEILALIPARGGSKGVPRKNIKLLAGKPLISWTIESAQQATSVSRIVVSTDDAEIADVAKVGGAEVPFLRPAEFARDQSTDFPVYQHALSWLQAKQGYLPDIVAWLRPTAPLRSGEDIDSAVAQLIATGADWVRSVCLVEHHPYWMFDLEGDRLQPFIPGVNIADYLRRQLLPPAYRLNGVVDVTWATTIMEKELLYGGDVRGYVMPNNRSVDIDTEIDFIEAEALMTRKDND